jgi:hypothetical protein
MATVAPATDCRRRGAVLSRMSTAVLFLGVVIIGAVASARWITSTTVVSSSSSRLSDVVCPSAVHLSRAMAVANYANNSLSMTERERERESSRAYVSFWDQSNTRRRRRRVWVCSITAAWVGTSLFLVPFLLSSAHNYMARCRRTSFAETSLISDTAWYGLQLQVAWPTTTRHRNLSPLR